MKKLVLWLEDGEFGKLVQFSFISFFVFFLRINEEGMDHAF